MCVGFLGPLACVTADLRHSLGFLLSPPQVLWQQRTDWGPRGIRGCLKSPALENGVSKGWPLRQGNGLISMVLRGALTSLHSLLPGAQPAHYFCFLSRVSEAKRGQVKGFARLILELCTHWPWNLFGVRFRADHPMLELPINVLLATASNSLGMRM